jgi:hypothetical protein
MSALYNRHACHSVFVCAVGQIVTSGLVGLGTQCARASQAPQSSFKRLTNVMLVNKRDAC